MSALDSPIKSVYATLKPIRLPEFLFKKNSIDSDSINFIDNKGEIRELLKTLIDNPNITIEIGAHASQDESNKYSLSLHRAEFLKQLLIYRDINPKRIFIKAYGDMYPIINKKQIDSLKTIEEKEIALKKNRRATFKVLTTDFKE